NSITINNTNGVDIAGGGVTAKTSLTLTAGNVRTTATNLLTLATTITAPPTGSATSHVDGPLGIQVQVTSASTRTFAVGASGAWRPLVIKLLNTGGVLRTFTAQVLPGPTGGTPQNPLQSLTTTRYWRIGGSANLNNTARVNLAFGLDDGVGTLANARVAQATTSNGTYSNLGGATTGTSSAGTVESTANLSPGGDYFAIASTGSLAATWDGGAGTSNWGDAANWNPDGVPGVSANVTLAPGSPISINVNGTFPLNNLNVGANTTLSLLTGTLNVAGAYFQSGGSVDAGSGALNVTSTLSLAGGSLSTAAATITGTGVVTMSGGTLALNGTGRLLATSDFTQSGGTIGFGSGTLEVKGTFSRTAGTFNAGTGTTIFSGTNTQVLGGGVSYYNLILRNGGNGKPKRFTSEAFYTVNNDFTVENTAQVSLSSADATDFTIWGNLNYSGLPSGTNISNFKIGLRGAGKFIQGATGSPQPAPIETEAHRVKVPAGEVREVNLLTDPARAVVLEGTGHGKRRLRLDNTFEKKRGEVERLLAAARPGDRLVINLDDRTIMLDLAPIDELASAASELNMPVSVEYGAAYTLGGNTSVAASRLLTIAGRLECGTSTISGAGGISLSGTLATMTASATGLGGTVVTSGADTYVSGSIVEYNAAGNQTISAVNHPAASLIRTAGSGTKTLDADKTITGDSGALLTEGALYVGAGTT
ncbi:MAG TPA: hypothetical protein VF720_14375, partial [Candidatus Eisenbacteria bacterium]